MYTLRAKCNTISNKYLFLCSAIVKQTAEVNYDTQFKDNLFKVLGQTHRISKAKSMKE